MSSFNVVDDIEIPNGSIDWEVELVPDPDVLVEMNMVPALILPVRHFLPLRLELPGESGSERDADRLAQASQRLGSDLRNPRLREAENLCDLVKLELLEIIEC